MSDTKPFWHVLMVKKTTYQRWRKAFTSIFSGLIPLRLAARTDVLRQKGWHFISSLRCVFLSASFCNSLCSLLKSGTWWMIWGWKLGLSYRNPNFSFLLRSAVRSFGLADTVEFSCFASVTVKMQWGKVKVVKAEVRSLHYIVKYLPLELYQTRHQKPLKMEQF